MRTITINGGARVAMGALEVVRIPDESVAGDLLGHDDLESALRAEFVGLLDEVASMHGTLAADTGLVIELVFRAVPVADQPHTADIRTFFVARALAPSPEHARESVRDVLALAASVLEGAAYDTIPLEPGALDEVYPPVEQTYAVQRRARILDLHNAALPSAFVYDRWPEQTAVTTRVFSALTNAPGTFFAIQLELTSFTPAERHFVDATALSLGALERGVADPSMGGVSFAIARRPAETYAYYSDRGALPAFVHNVVVGGPRTSARLISSRVIGALASASDGLDLAVVPLPADVVALDQDIVALPWRVAEAVATSPTLRPGAVPPSGHRLPQVITAEEASQLFRVPCGSRRVGAGFAINRTLRRSRGFDVGVAGGSELTAGSIGTPDAGVEVGFGLRDLTRHMFVAGTPGSGKTTFNVGLLDRLWREHAIPFLVIEPAKNEYRALLETIPDLQVFTPGKSWISPLVLNPFRPPDGVRLENHKTVLKTAFAAAVTMTSPLDRLFETALDRLYDDHGWLESDTVAAGHAVPSIRDFVAAFEAAVERVGYTGDAQNIGRAGVVRLAAMVRSFDTVASLPIADLCSRPTVIELAAIENAAEKTLLIALVLLSLLSHHNANTVGDGSLRQVLLLEEAHVLFDANDGGQEGAASPAAIAQGLLKRMLAEIRSAGVGVIVADQSPRKVGGDVIALTSIKLAFRLVEAEDRRIIGDSTNMSDEQVSRLAGLRTGEAFLFHDRLAEPEEIRTPDHRADRGIAISLTDEALAARAGYFRDHPELLRPYPECDLVPAWDPARHDLARQFARRVFDLHVDPDCSDFASARTTYRRLRPHAARLDVRHPEVDDVLLDMIRVHFLRLLRYETRLGIDAAFIRSVLTRQRQES